MRRFAPQLAVVLTLLVIAAICLGTMAAAKRMEPQAPAGSFRDTMRRVRLEQDARVREVRDLIEQVRSMKSTR